MVMVWWTQSFIITFSYYVSTGQFINSCVLTKKQWDFSVSRIRPFSVATMKLCNMTEVCQTFSLNGSKQKKVKFEVVHHQWYCIIQVSEVITHYMRTTEHFCWGPEYTPTFGVDSYKIASFNIFVNMSDNNTLILM